MQMDKTLKTVKTRQMNCAVKQLRAVETAFFIFLQGSVRFLNVGEQGILSCLQCSQPGHYGPLLSLGHTDIWSAVAAAFSCSQNVFLSLEGIQQKAAHTGTSISENSECIKYIHPDLVRRISMISPPLKKRKKDVKQHSWHPFGRFPSVCQKSSDSERSQRRLWMLLKCTSRSCV